jgi:hypothetical protein
MYLKRIVYEPAITIDAQVPLMNKVQNDEVSDTTGDAIKNKKLVS